MKRACLLLASLALCAGAGAANNTPLSGAWNIAPSGSAASTGELVFRMTPGDGSDPVEVTVTVRSGTNDIGVARDIRQAMSAQLRRDQFNVQLGEGANVLVTDPRGKPNFSLELLDSDVENLRVVVQSVAPGAPPTVPEQAVPATPPQTAPAPNTTPGNALPPTGLAPANAAQPAASPPEVAAPFPSDSPPPSTGGAGQPALAPPPDGTTGGSAAASAPPGNGV